MRHLLVVATENVHKLQELRAMLGDSEWHVRGASELGVPVPKVVEDGDTFEANASKKAEAIAKATFALTLADDSGLEVDALGGAPGVRSARFAHERATDAENNAALLEALRPILLAERHEGPRSGAASIVLTARFRCVLCLVDPFTSLESERRIVVSGACEGEITTTPRGSQGFGYDPLFLVQQERTFAELSDTEKAALSHRGKAMQQMHGVLANKLAARKRLLGALA